MSAIRDFISEIQRQADLLDHASSRDSLGQYLTNNPGRRQAGHRVWTRQDKNREEFALAMRQGALSVDDEVPRGRMDTRLCRVLRRLPELAKWHGRALEEAQAAGTFSLIALLVVECSEAHAQLIVHYHGQSHFKERDLEDWNATLKRHAEAVERLSMHLPATSVATEPDAIADKSPRKAGSTRKPSSRGLSKEQYNIEAREALKGRPAGGGRWTIRKLKKALGCGKGTVSNLPAWQEYYRAYERKRASGRSVSARVPLDSVSAFVASDAVDDPSELAAAAELESLIREQEADQNSNCRSRAPR